MSYQTIGSVDLKNEQELKGKQRRKKPKNKFIREREKSLGEARTKEGLTYDAGDIFNNEQGYVTYKRLKEDMERRRG